MAKLIETMAEQEFAKEPTLIEERINSWRQQSPGEEDEDYVSLLCDAETELCKLRGAMGEAALLLGESGNKERGEDWHHRVVRWLDRNGYDIVTGDREDS